MYIIRAAAAADPREDSSNSAGPATTTVYIFHCPPSLHPEPTATNTTLSPTPSSSEEAQVINYVGPSPQILATIICIVIIILLLSFAIMQRRLKYIRHKYAKSLESARNQISIMTNSASNAGSRTGAIIGDSGRRSLSWVGSNSNSTTHPVDANSASGHSSTANLKAMNVLGPSTPFEFGRHAIASPGSESGSSAGARSVQLHNHHHHNNSNVHPCSPISEHYSKEESIASGSSGNSVLEMHYLPPVSLPSPIRMSAIEVGHHAGSPWGSQQLHKSEPSWARRGSIDEVIVPAPPTPGSMRSRPLVVSAARFPSSDSDDLSYVDEPSISSAPDESYTSSRETTPEASSSPETSDQEQDSSRETTTEASSPPETSDQEQDQETSAKVIKRCVCSVSASSSSKSTMSEYISSDEEDDEDDSDSDDDSNSDSNDESPSASHPERDLRNPFKLDPLILLREFLAKHQAEQLAAAAQEEKEEAENAAPKFRPRTASRRNSGASQYSYDRTPSDWYAQSVASDSKESIGDPSDEDQDTSDAEDVEEDDDDEEDDKEPVDPALRNTLGRKSRYSPDWLTAEELYALEGWLEAADRNVSDSDADIDDDDDDAKSPSDDSRPSGDDDNDLVAETTADVEANVESEVHADHEGNTVITVTIEDLSITSNEDISTNSIAEASPIPLARVDTGIEIQPSLPDPEAINAVGIAS
ncbi:hypothetical protein DFH27DRAFT_599044 [Peziza echinospora]|nr:hypothetical protein DFH27DRAFT_599044 [Peziza echinospora]